MAQLEKLLREEIRKTARKEIAPVIRTLQGTVKGLKAELRSLKRKLEDREREARHVERQNTLTKALAATADDGAQLRWSPDWLKGWRTKAGVSAPALSGLLGVSSSTIYNWEAGKTRPDDVALAQLAQLRKLGKRALRDAISAQGTPA